MAQTETASVAIQPDLRESLELYAQTANQSIESVTDEALRFYINCNAGTNQIRRYHAERARELGLEIEDYIARMIKEWRREERELQLNASRSS